MEINVGYLYHIKDEFFELINDKYLMLNHENGHSRPNYFVLKEGEFYWAIPLSSKIKKYKELSLKKSKHQRIHTIIIENLVNRPCAILIQNAFPVDSAYIKSIHMINNQVLHFTKTTEEEILKNFKKMLILKKNGINLFYPNVDRIKLLLTENRNLVNV